MQTGSAILLTSMLCCSATALAMYYLDQQPAHAEKRNEPVLGEPGLQRIEERLQRLEERIARPAAPEGAPVAGPARREPNLSRDDVRSIVLEVLREYVAEAGPKTGLPDFDLEKGFAALLEPGLEWEDREAILKRAKASGNLDALIAKLEQRAKDNPAIADVQFELGQAYLTQLEGMPPGQESGRLALEADQAFDKALAVQPEHWGARYVKAVALSFWPPMFGKKREAIEHFEILRAQQEKSAESRPEYADTYLHLGNLYSDQGKAEEAQKIWAEGRKRFPKHAGLNERLGGK